MTEVNGRANLLALKYRSDMERRRLSSATVRRRLAALKSLVKLAKTIGLTNWTLEIESPKVRRVRDTRGSGLDGYRRLLAQASCQEPAKAARDTAMLRLMGDRGLRRSEVVSLDMHDVDFENERIAVKGKGGDGEKEWLTTAAPTLDALRRWMTCRVSEGAALFVSFDRRSLGRRLTDNGLYRVVGALARKARVSRWNPHGLRHTSVTLALELTGGNLRAAQRFARHSDPKITLVYDDDRRDLAGETARRVADAV